jgi:hypothetical protein
MPYAAAFSVGGLVLNLFGVLLLFRYGMPFRVATGGFSSYTPEEPDEAEIQKDNYYKRIGYLGLALVFLGTAGQITGALVTN